MLLYKCMENNNNLNAYGVYLVLELLTTSQKYLDIYIQTFPGQEENALSFSVDPGWSCRTHLIDHYNNNQPAVDSLTHKFVTDHPNEINLKQFIKKYDTVHVAGQYFKIDKTESAYAEFVQNMQTQRWAFRYMSVTADEDKYVIFFA